MSPVSDATRRWSSGPRSCSRNLWNRSELGSFCKSSQPFAKPGRGAPTLGHGPAFVAVERHQPAQLLEGSQTLRSIVASMALRTCRDPDQVEDCSCRFLGGDRAAIADIIISNISRRSVSDRQGLAPFPEVWKSFWRARRASVFVSRAHSFCRFRCRRSYSASMAISLLSRLSSPACRGGRPPRSVAVRLRIDRRLAFLVFLLAKTGSRET